MVIQKYCKLRAIFKFCSILFRRTTVFLSLYPKFKCVLNILFDKQNNLYQRGFLGSAMFNVENTQPLRRWQTLRIIYGNTPRSVSENVLENNIFF